VLRRMFGFNEEVTGDWRRLHNDLHNQCIQYGKIEGEMGSGCGMRGRDEKCIQNFGWKAFREEDTW